MEIYSKSTQELAAQAIDTHLLADASFDPKLIPNGASLVHQFTEQKALVQDALRARVPESDLRQVKTMPTQLANTQALFLRYEVQIRSIF